MRFRCLTCFHLPQQKQTEGHYQHAGPYPDDHQMFLTVSMGEGQYLVETYVDHYPSTESISLDHLDSCFRRACLALDAGNDIV